MPTRTATHAILSRLGVPSRVAAMSDWQAMSDMRVAASLTIGIYTLAEVTADEAARAECIIAGRRDAARTMAGPEWRMAA